VRKLHGLPEIALIDMGDFVGGMLKYLRFHPVESVTVAGGVAKMAKLGQGLLDLHSRRGEVDLRWLSRQAPEGALREAIAGANTAKHAFDLAQAAGFDLAGPVARAAWETAAKALGAGAAKLEIAVFDRDGALKATTGLRHVSPR
jgi:cobalt-precorrin-5B (C1)-methyltransferase